MKKGFTLLELVVVIIILGVLATLGIQQYARMVERARGAEARTIIGQIRSAAAAHRLQYGNLVVPAFTNAAAGVGTSIDQIPSACRNTHYFAYGVTATTAESLTVAGTRCTAAGKVPQAPTALTINLVSNFANGVDTWAGTGGY